MKIVVTGAGGFVGHTLVNKLKQQAEFSELLLVDRSFPESTTLREENENIVTLSGDINDPVVIKRIFSDKVDTLYHLAALPGGAAEADPALSKRINLDATLALFEAAAQASCKRLVYSSSIAVLNPALVSEVNDSTPLSPSITYGYHKAMVELAIGDMARRQALDIVGLRLPGIVARPLAPSGLKSSFLSDIFHALQAHKPFVSPVSKTATFWMMSARQCAENLGIAATADSSLFPSSRVMTFPAIHCSMGELIEAISAQTGADPSLVTFNVDESLERVFGSHPPLKTPAAERAGLSADASLEQLVTTVLADL